MEVEEVGEADEVAEGFGEGGELIVAEVEGAEVFEVADFWGDFGELIVGEDEGFEVSLLPDVIRYDAEMAFP